MMKLLRKHRSWLMTVIAILAIPFCVYFVKTDMTQIRGDQFARIYDRNVSVVEARRYGRLLDMARAIGLSELPNYLTQGAGEKEMYPACVMNPKNSEFALRKRK